MNMYLKIKEIAERKNITQNEIGDALGVTGKTAHNYLNGHTKISIEQIPVLAKVLRVPISELFNELGTSNEASSYHDAKCTKCKEKDDEILRLKSKLYEVQDKYTRLLEEMHGDSEINKQCG